MREVDGWDYSGHVTGADSRKLVTLQQDGMIWIGIRAWNFGQEKWMDGNGSGPEMAEIVAWRDLPEIAHGWWDRGKLHIPRKSKP